MKYRADIDGLRAIAVTPVVLFHTGLGFPGGFIGVDIFFVISGFLLSKIIIQEIEEKRFSFFAFYERRIRRLAPALIVMLATCLGMFSLVMLPRDFSDLANSTWATIFIHANFYFYNSLDYFSPAASLIPLLHTWSLAIEEQFYLVLPFALIAGSYVIPKHWLPFAILLALLLSFGLCIHYTNSYKPFAFYKPHTRAWELLAGTLLAAVPRLPSSTRLINMLGSAALVALAVAFSTFDERDAFPGWLAAVPVLATITLIYSGSVAPQCLTSRLLALPPLVFVGRISYSLYLWHWPIIVFVEYGDLNLDSQAVKLVCVAVSFLLATLSWAFIEETVRRRRIFSSRLSVYVAAGVSASILVVLALGIRISDGFPGRVPTDLMAFLDKSRYETGVPECFFKNERVAASAKPCLRGTPGQAPSFILVGDSHSYALSPALFHAAKARGLAGLQYTASAFLPAPGRRPVGGNRDDPRLERVLEIIEEHPEARTVIISAVWADYATGQNWKGKSWLFQDDVAIAHNSDENIPIFKRAMERLIEMLPDREIVLLDDVPAGIELDLDFYVRRSMLRQVKPEEAMLPFEEAQRLRSIYEPILQDIAAVNTNVIYIPVFADFCAPPGCFLFSADGSFPIYRDGEHLSNQGAMLWKEKFLERVVSGLQN